MPLRMPLKTCEPFAQHPIQPHACFICLNLARIGRPKTVVMRSANCRPAFRKLINPVIFDAVNREDSAASRTRRAFDAENLPW